MISVVFKCVYKCAYVQKIYTGNDDGITGDFNFPLKIFFENEHYRVYNHKGSF